MPNCRKEVGGGKGKDGFGSNRLVYFNYPPFKKESGDQACMAYDKCGKRSWVGGRLFSASQNFLYFFHEGVLH